MHYKISFYRLTITHNQVEKKKNILEMYCSQSVIFDLPKSIKVEKIVLRFLKAFVKDFFAEDYKLFYKRTILSGRILANKLENDCS